jgi:hypothetical protein
MPTLAAAHNFVVLPSSQHEFLSHCSSIKNKITGGWKITLKALSNIEQDLVKLNEFSKSGREYANYTKQYVGVLVGSRQYIYINAAKKKQLLWLLPEVVQVCDGGLSYYEALYNIDSREFIDFKIGGF